MLGPCSCHRQAQRSDRKIRISAQVPQPGMKPVHRTCSVWLRKIVLNDEITCGLPYGDPRESVQDQYQSRDASQVVGCYTINDAPGVGFTDFFELGCVDEDFHTFFPSCSL